MNKLKLKKKRKKHKLILEWSILTEKLNKLVKAIYHVQRQIIKEKRQFLMEKTQNKLMKLLRLQARNHKSLISNN